jgi:hypothetical protein
MAEVAPGPIDSPAPRVFVSYAHESEAHAEAVRELSYNELADLARNRGDNEQADAYFRESVRAAERGGINPRTLEARQEEAKGDDDGGAPRTDLP